MCSFIYKKYWVNTDNCVQLNLGTQYTKYIYIKYLPVISVHCVMSHTYLHLVLKLSAGFHLTLLCYLAIPHKL